VTATPVVAPTATPFAELGIPAALTTALAEQGIHEPFPVQALCIPPALEGRDVCGKAKTGSGKTLAFGLPLLLRIGKGTPRRPRGLVLVPTRELALQVHDVLEPLAAAIGKRVVAVYGGAPLERQVTRLRAGADVVVATPGRLIDLGERGDVDVSNVSVVVLDEADRMADMGFMPQVEWVLRRLPKQRQTLLFSATLDGDVDHLRRHYLTDPVSLEVESETETVDEMEHRFIGVHQLDKVKVLAAITRGAERTLVFVRTKRGADRLVDQLAKEGVKASAIHGDLRQLQRERALKSFAAGRLHVLVATDVAARGIHVDGIDVVVLYDPPEDHKSYVHRSGRTARAGESGLVVTLVLWDQRFEVELLARRLGVREQVEEMFSNDPRLGDLRAWQPAAPAPEAEPAPVPLVAPVTPAVAAAQAVLARKAAQRAQSGRRRPRR
jgi:superfamily II DNA/RNA helicase